MSKMNLADIEELAREYADERGLLAERVAELQTIIRDAEDELLLGIKEAAVAARDAETKLLTTVRENPELFEKPKSRIFFGIKLGWQKQKGKISFSSAQALVERIKKVMPEQVKTLVRVSESVQKKSLEALDGRELKRLGVTVEADTDAPFVRPVDTDIDKIVDGLLAREVVETAEPNG